MQLISTHQSRVGPLETESEMEISMQGYQGKLLGKAPVEGSGRSLDWAEGDASCDEVPVQAPGDLTGSSRAGMVLWTCPELGEGAGPLHHYVSHRIECGLPCREVWPLAKQFSSESIMPKKGWQLVAAFFEQSQHLEKSFILPRGIWAEGHSTYHSGVKL